MLEDLDSFLVFFRGCFQLGLCYQIQLVMEEDAYVTSAYWTPVVCEELCSGGWNKPSVCQGEATTEI